ncbi:MAG: dTDP-4-amino-4,6-dideoxygalactose transaminase [Parvibaculum sp.]|nr:dTDP-4-amino-4,6-dideoxygalactose transaminase [Parvibaculum sp.]
MSVTIPYSKPSLDGNEQRYLLEALQDAHLSGDGRFTKACHAELEKTANARKALLTHSCTAALEISALLLDIAPGDEIIMPSYTFVSTANAFVLRGGVPVFIDVRADTVNMDEALIEQAITPKTKAIAPVHYAGVSCEMDTILDIAKAKGLAVVEDAAQGLGATYKGRALGTMGDLGALSFHASKNVVSGEGGALFVNRPDFAERAEIIREKGTNRSRFLRGEVDKYTWVDKGSSYLPSEIVAALLLAQLERADKINARRVALWTAYHHAFEDMERAGKFRRPTVPQSCSHNGHIYYLVFPDAASQARARGRLVEAGIGAPSHYVPLHSSPGGQRFGRVAGSMKNTDQIGDGLLRLPVFGHMTDEQHARVVEIVLGL